MVSVFEILSPLDGDMLTAADGRLTAGCLTITVRVSAPFGEHIDVNGIPARFDGGDYRVEIPLCGYRNLLVARRRATGESRSITVYWLRNFAGKYRLSLDDNIWFLQDIACNADRYKSIFENPYLGFYRQVHDDFGTKVHINIYYQTAGFNLTQMPDKYKPEWKDNADWLQLSFHALQDSPDRPYISTGYDEVQRDCQMVQEQVRRFAGEEVMGPVTTLHWGEATEEGCRALRDCGYRCQVGDFNVDNSLPPVSYYLDVEQRRHINRRTIWKDNKHGIIFFRSAIIIDCHKLENIRTFLNDFRAEPQRSGFVDLLIHEQYFYQTYSAYQPDYRQKVLAAVRWAHKNGYKPAFLGECVFE